MDKQVKNYLKILETTPTNVPAFKALKKIFTDGQQWEDLASLYEQRALAVPSKAAELCLEAAQLYQQELKMPEQMERILLDLLSRQPENEEASTLLENHFRETSQWSRLKGMLAQRFEREENETSRSALALRLAELEDQPEGDPREKERYLNLAVQLNAGNRGALSALRSLYLARNQWNEAVATMDRELLLVTDENDVATILYDTGRALADDPFEIERAKIILDRSGDAAGKKKRKQIDKLIADLDRYKEKWREIVPVFLEDAMSREDKQEASRLYYKVAAILCLYNPSDHEGVMDALTKSLLLDPSDAKALRLSEQYLSEHHDIQLLKNFYNSVAERTRDNTLKSYCLSRNAALCQQDGDSEKAMALYQEAFELDPTEDGAFNAIAAMLREKEMWVELSKQYERRIELFRDPAFKVDNLIALGLLLKDKLHSPMTARDHFEEALALKPTAVEAALALVPYYEEDEDYDLLVKALVIIFDNETDPTRKAEAGLTLARRMKDLGRMDEALAAARSVFGLDQGEETLDTLEAIALEQDALDDVVTRYLALADTLGDDRRNLRLKLMLRSAAMLDRELSQYERAETLYVAILEQDPDNLDVLRSLGKLYLKDDQWEKLVDAYERIITITDDDDEKRSLVLERGQILEMELERLEDAAAAYEQAIALFPEELEAYKSLERIYRLLEDYQKLSGAIGAELSILTSIPERINLLYQLGDLKENRIDDLDGAVAAYSEVLNLDDSHLPSIEALERLLKAGRQGNLIFTALEPYYLKQKSYDKLAQGYANLLEVAENQDQKGHLYRKLAHLHGDLKQDYDTAYRWLEQALVANEKDVDILPDIRELAAKLQRSDRLVQILSEREAAVEDSGIKARYAAVKSQIYMEELNDPDQAEQGLLQAAQYAPQDIGILSSVVEFYYYTDSWHQYTVFAERLLPLVMADEGRYAELSIMLADTFNEKLTDTTRAIAVLETLLTQQPAADQARARLRALYRQAALWDRLVEHLRRELSFAKTDETIVNVKLELAQISEEVLEEHDKAADLLGEVLLLDSQEKTAIESLERLIDRDLAQNKAAGYLAPVYDRHGESGKLAKVLGVLFATTDDNDKKREYAERLSNISLVDLQNNDDSFQWALKAYIYSPGVEPGSNVETLALETGAWEQYLAALEEKKLQVIDESARLESVLLRQSEIAVEYLGDSRRALDYLNEFLNDAQAGIVLMDAAEPLLKTLERYEELFILWGRKREKVEERSAKRELVLKMAGLKQHELNDLPTARELMTDLLKERDNDIEVIDRIIEIDRAMEDWTALLDMYRHKLSLLREDQDVVPLKITMGELFEQHLEQPGEAMALYMGVIRSHYEWEVVTALIDRLLSQESTQLEVANEIELKLTKTREWNKLVSVHEIQLRHQDNKEEKGKLLAKLSAIYYEKLKDPHKAFEGFTRVFIEDPYNDEALFELEKLASELGFWGELAEVYERGADVLDQDHPRARDLLLKAAQLYEEILAQQDDSIRAYRKVLNHDAVNITAIKALEVLCRKAELWPELVDIYRQRIDLTEDMHEKRDLYWSICELYENPDQLNDILATQPYYEALLNLDESDMQVQATLLDLYNQTENWEKTAHILEIQVEQAMDEDDQVLGMLKLATLSEERRQMPAEAIAWYRRIVEAKPDHDIAFGALERYVEVEEHQQELAPFLAPLYRERECWDRYIDCLEYRLKFIEGAQSRSEILLTMADTYETRREDLSMAYVAYTRAFREDSGSAYIQTQLERLAAPLGRFTDLVALYEEELSRIGAAPDLENRGALIIGISLQAATLYEEHIQDLDKATEKLQAVLAVEPKHPEALAKLERIYSVQQRWPELIDVLRLRLDIARELEDRKTIFYRISNIYEEEIRDNDRAIAVYREMLEEDPRDSDIIHALARLCRNEEKWEDLIGVLEHEVGVVDALDQKRHVYNQIAQVKWQQLGQGDDAQHILTDIVAAEPENWEARELLEAMLADAAVELGASIILAPLYEAESEWARLIDMLLIQEKHAAEAPEKRRLNERVAVIYEREIGRNDQAFTYWCAAIANDPMDESLAEHLSELAEELQQWTDLVRHYQTMLTALADDEVALFVYRVRSGQIYLDKLDDPETSEPFFRRALEQQPNDRKLLDTLQIIYETLERWNEMVAILFRKADLAQELSEKLSLYLLAANTQEFSLGNVTAAIDTFNIILSHDPDNVDSLSELDRLYSAEERFGELEDVLKRLALLTRDEGDRTGLEYRRANLWREKLGNVETAIDLYASIIAANNQYEPAYESLTELVSETAYQERALAVLTPVYQEADRWDKVADLYERKLPTIQEREARVELLNIIKEIHELRLEDKAAAFATARRLYLEDYENPITAAELERLAVDSGGYEGLVETYLEIADSVQDAEFRQEIYQQVADVAEHKLYDNVLAIGQLKKVLEISSENLEAAENLDRLYEAEQMWVELVELIPRKLPLFASKKDVFEQKLRLAHLWEEKLSDNTTAIDIFEEILAEKPDNIDALQSLQRLYEAEGQHEQLVQVLRAEVRIARGDANKARLYSRMADVLFENLDRTKEALNLYNRVLQFDESNEEVIEKMERLYENMGMWDQLVVHIQKQLRRARRLEEKVAANKKLAHVYRTHLQLEDKAVSLYHKVLELVPDDMEVVGTLEDIYINNKAWQKLADLLKLLLSRVEPDKQRQINLRLSSLYFQYMGDAERAIAYGRKVLEASPTLDELTGLEHIFRDSEHKDIYYEILTKQIDATEEPPQKIFLLLRLADLALSQGDHAQAIGCYERILAIDETHLLASEALEPLYIEAERWESLVRVYQIMLQEYGKGAERLQIQTKLAATYEERLGDFTNAFEVNADIFKENLERYDLVAKTEELARKCDQLISLVRLYRDVYNDIPDVHQQRILCAKIASIYEHELLNQDLAAEYYKIFLEFGEYEEHAVDFLINYYREYQEWEDLITSLEYKLPFLGGADKVALYHQIGQIYGEELVDIGKTIDTYRAAYQYDETNLVTIDNLIKFLDIQENWKDLAEMLRQKLHVVGEAAQQLDLRLCIARLYESRLEDMKSAKVYYRAVVAEDPNHREALDALERIYTVEENYDEMLEVLTRKVTIVESNQEKIDIYRKMAGIWETHFEQMEMAITYYEKTLQIDEGYIPSINDLERIYRSIGNWESLVRTFERHIAQSADVDEIVKLYSEIGRIFSEQLNQPDMAIDNLNKALTIAPENIDVLSVLSDLYQAGEQWNEAVEVLRKMVSFSQDKQERTTFIIHIADIMKDKLLDEDRALAQLNELFREDTSYVPAIRALRRFYQETQRWDEFLGMVEHEKEHITQDEDMARLLFEESIFYYEQRSDSGRAIDLLRQAIGRKPDYDDAIKQLAGLAYDNGMWEDAWKYLNKSVALYDQENEDDNKPLAQVYYRLGRVAGQVGKEDLALRYYGESYRRDADNLDTLEALADVLYRKQDWEQAFRVYQTMLVRFRDQKTTEELVTLFCRLGEINGKMDKHDVAVRMYEKALEINPNSEEALSASVHYYESLGRWAKVIKYRVTLARLLEADGAFEQYMTIGDIYRDHLGQTKEALEYYSRALQKKADDVGLLEKVASLLEAENKWSDAIAAYRRIVKLEKAPQRRVAIMMRLATLIRDYGDDPTQCVQYFNNVLDLDPGNTFAFDQLERYLADKKAWDQLDNIYRLQIARLADASVEEKVDLWRKLADVLVNKSDNLDEGIKAYEVMVSLKPDSDAHKIELANLYSRNPKYYKKAVSIHESILSKDVYNIQSHTALFGLKFNLEQFDRAFLHTSLIKVLGGSDEKAMAFYEEHSRESRTEALDFIDRNEWYGYLTHPDGRNIVGQIFTMLFHHMGDIAPSDLKNQGLRKRDKLDLNESINFCQTTNYVLRTLGAPAPEIYLKQGVGEEIILAPLYPSTLMIPSNAFENYSQRDLLFHVGRAVTFARPDFILATMYAAQDLHDYLEATLQMFMENYPIVGEAERIANLRRRIDKAVPRKLRPQMEEFVKEFLKTRNHFDFNSWYTSLFLTANRAGLVICNDLQRSLRWVEHYSEGEPGEWVELQRRDLIAFWASDDYSYLRRKLGFSIV